MLQQVHLYTRSDMSLELVATHGVRLWLANLYMYVCTHTYTHTVGSRPRLAARNWRTCVSSCPHVVALTHGGTCREWVASVVSRLCTVHRCAWSQRCCGTVPWLTGYAKGQYGGPVTPK